MRNFRQLEIWQEGIEMVHAIYLLTKNYPKEEKYGLISQMRRCAVSIPSNIAEGCRGSNKEMANFLRISQGSSYELETQLIISHKLRLISKTKMGHIVDTLILLQRRIGAYQKCLS